VSETVEPQYELTIPADNFEPKELYTCVFMEARSIVTSLWFLFSALFFFSQGRAGVGTKRWCSSPREKGALSISDNQIDAFTCQSTTGAHH
jgi:hypothetical protein